MKAISSSFKLLLALLLLAAALTAPVAAGEEARPALNAYHLSLEGKKKPAPIDGFTDDQRFFLSFAQLWRGKIRDEALKRTIQEDVHPWGEFRVNGAPFNVPEFYTIFDIKPGDKLYRPPDKRPVIW